MSGEFSIAQPPVAADRLAAASGALKRYRFMAFATGVVLILGCLALILKALDVPHMEPAHRDHLGRPTATCSWSTSSSPRCSG